MPYKVIIDGVPVECATPEEARELARLHANAAKEKPNPAEGGLREKVHPVRKLPPSRRAAKGNIEKDRAVLKVLSALADAPRTVGIDAPTVASLAGLESPKGTGSFMTYMNGRIKALGFQPSKVIGAFREQGRRRWRKGPATSSAISALEDATNDATEPHRKMNGGKPMGAHVG